MQSRENEFDDGRVLFGVHPRGNASPVVFDRHAAVGAQRHRNPSPETGEHFVARVVDDFLHDVKGIVGERVHARTLLDGLKPFEHANGTDVVILCPRLLYHLTTLKHTRALVLESFRVDREGLHDARSTPPPRKRRKARRD